jgi:phosphoribosylformylglycinamidine cyclo-ligase
MAHITGGGITENLPRILPPGSAADVVLGSWTVPSIFSLIRERGSIAMDEMLRAFNMGVGMVLVCAAADERQVLESIARAGEPHAWRLGRISSGERQVRYLA